MSQSVNLSMAQPVSQPVSQFLKSISQHSTPCPRAASVPAPLPPRGLLLAVPLSRAVEVLGGRLSFISPLLSLFLARKPAKPSHLACCGSGSGLFSASGSCSAPLLPTPGDPSEATPGRHQIGQLRGNLGLTCCNPSDCFNMLHNMFSVTGHAQHVVSSSSSDHRPEDSAAATHVAWPGMVGPGHFPPPPYYSERGLPGVGRVGW